MAAEPNVDAGVDLDRLPGLIPDNEKGRLTLLRIMRSRACNEAASQIRAHQYG